MTDRFDGKIDHAFGGVRQVDPSHQVNFIGLETWLKNNVPDFSGAPNYFQFNGGQSNPTYKIVTPEKSYVLRRQPAGNLLPSAHGVDREYRVLTALSKTDFPVPRTYGLCDDLTIMGCSFYVMEMIDGRVLWDLTIPDMSHEDRRSTYFRQIETLASLHNIDVGLVGLSDFGRPNNYFSRQITRWTGQYRMAEATTIDPMERLISGLPKLVPKQDRTTIVHGDYRLDNMILHQSRPEILAIIDWELSTLGDPLADLAWFLMAWILPASERASFRGADIGELGIPNIEEVIGRYCQLTGRTGIENIDWLLAFTLFRLAAICQGISRRTQQGLANNSHALSAAQRVPILANCAMHFASKAEA